jgi:endonuclease-3
MPINRVEPLLPLFKLYKHRNHPLDYKNRYQLVVMVVLSAQTTDENVNQLAPDLFKRYPSMQALAAAKPGELFPYIRKVRNFANKAKWLTAIAATLKNDKAIPSTMETLTELPGIGRKSANVIIRGSGGTAEGIIVDLHVLRVASRIGIAMGDKPEKIEQQLMELVPKKYWNEAGMALSFLGREICRPTDPNCPECPMTKVCVYYKTVVSKAGKKKSRAKEKKR